LGLSRTETSLAWKLPERKNQGSPRPGQPCIEALAHLSHLRKKHRSVYKAVYILKSSLISSSINSETPPNDIKHENSPRFCLYTIHPSTHQMSHMPKKCKPGARPTNRREHTGRFILRPTPTSARTASLSKWSSMLQTKAPKQSYLVTVILSKQQNRAVRSIIQQKRIHKTKEIRSASIVNL